MTGSDSVPSLKLENKTVQFLTPGKDCNSANIVTMTAATQTIDVSLGKTS